MRVAIIKYNAGNIRSVDIALSRLGVKSSITDDHREIRDADKVEVPKSIGVGAVQDDARGKTGETAGR